MIEALKYHLLKPEEKTSCQSPRTRPRQPVGLPKVILVIRVPNEFQHVYVIGSVSGGGPKPQSYPRSGMLRF